MAAWEHGALNVEQSITRSVATEEPCLMTIINSQSVTVAQPQVSILVPDGSCRHHIMSLPSTPPPHRRSPRSPCRRQWPSESRPDRQQWSPGEEQLGSPRLADSPGSHCPPDHPEWWTCLRSTSCCPSHGSSHLLITRGVTTFSLLPYLERSWRCRPERKVWWWCSS